MKKIWLLSASLLLAFSVVNAQSTATAGAFATIINPAALSTLPVKGFTTVVTPRANAYLTGKSNSTDDLLVIAGMANTSSRIIPAGKIITGAPDLALYGISLPASVIFHLADGSAYLKGNLTICDAVGFENSAGMRQHALELEVKIGLNAVNGNYMAMPGDISINYN